MRPLTTRVSTGWGSGGREGRLEVCIEAKSENWKEYTNTRVLIPPNPHRGRDIDLVLQNSLRDPGGSTHRRYVHRTRCLYCKLKIPRTGGLLGTPVCTHVAVGELFSRSLPSEFSYRCTTVVNKTRPARFYLQFSGVPGFPGFNIDPDRAFLCMCNCVAATSVTAAELWLWLHWLSVGSVAVESAANCILELHFLRSVRIQSP